MRIERQCALVEANDLRESITRDPFHARGACPEYEVQRISIVGRSGGLSIGQFEVERNSDAAGYLVLQCEQIADIAVELLGPQMRVGLGVNQLGIDPNL